MRAAALHHPRRLAAGVLVALALTLAASVAPSSQGTVACSHFGTTWAHRYDLRATHDGNPIRIVSACCEPIKGSHVNACFLKVGEVGIAEHGCERIDLNAAGAVVSEGEHATCP